MRAFCGHAEAQRFKKWQQAFVSAHRAGLLLLGILDLKEETGVQALFDSRKAYGKGKKESAGVT